MLRHPLATLEGEKEFIDFYRALLSREGSPHCSPSGKPSGKPSSLQACSLTVEEQFPEVTENSLYYGNYGITLIKGTYATLGRQRYLGHI